MGSLHVSQLPLHLETDADPLRSTLQHDRLPVSAGRTISEHQQPNSLCDEQLRRFGIGDGNHVHWAERQGNVRQASRGRDRVRGSGNEERSQGEGGIRWPKFCLEISSIAVGRTLR
jgi:hypothetical protein